MNFLRLFAAGKSMVGMKDRNCPYRMRTENLLPKFESTKNPCGLKAKVEAPRTEALPLVISSEPAKVAEVAPVVMQPALMETRPLFAPEPVIAPVAAVAEPILPVAAPLVIPISAEAEKIEVPEPVEIKISKSIRVVQKASNPFQSPATVGSADSPEQKKAEVVTRKLIDVRGWLKKINPLAHLPKRVANKPKAGRSAIQTELSLDRIQVLRNDLHDSDLEVVAPTTLSKPSVPPSRLQTLVKTETAALGRMTTKFFGAEETQVR